MKLLYEILKGVLMGIANIIPGVSGGTMAVSMGIYDKIIGSITNLLKDFKKSIKTLFPYIIGMAIGIVGLSFVIEYLFANQPLPTSMAFIGLILGGLPIMTQKIKGKKHGILNYGIFILFFAIIIGMELLGDGGGKQVQLTVGIVPSILLFLIGVIASATMVIPGVSGSMLLMILGYYEPIIQTINSFIKALIHFDMPVILQGMGILVPFGIGVVVGIFAIAKIIEILLAKYETLTYDAILGLVIASPIAILLNTNLEGTGFVNIITGIVTFVAGFWIAYSLGKKE